MTIDEYVASLSEEEKEQHKELIEECRLREIVNNKNRKEQEKLLRNLGYERIGRVAEMFLRGKLLAKA